MGKVIVIGAGPSGVMAAISASKKHSVTLLDSNEKVGKKLFITGKGRCNVTNSKDISEFLDYIPGNPYFLYSALYTFTNEHTMEFFENAGIELKKERGGRVFPASDKSSDILKGLNIGLKENNVKVKLNSTVTDIVSENNHIKEIIINDNEKLKADYYIIATGGVTYPKTGSNGTGHKLSKKIGHNVTPLNPSLVPLELNENWLDSVMGLNLKNINLTLKVNNKKVYDQQGEITFTFFGITGPLTLKASRYIDLSKNNELILDLKPALDLAQLDKRILSDFKKYLNKDFKNSLNDLFPQKLIPVIIKLSNIDENKKVNEITKEERKNLCNLIKNMKLNVKGFRPIEEAIVTSGGIDISEIDPSTMKSKIIDNLSFAGEVIDVDAFTGGYNVQVAFSTGFLAGTNLD